MFLKSILPIFTIICSAIFVNKKCDDSLQEHTKFSDTDSTTMSELLQSTPSMQEKLFKQTQDTTLKIYYIKPKSAKPGKRYPAVVWIHGGGWSSGTAATFFPHCKYFALRGAVGISIEYRLVKYGGSNMETCLMDCKSAIRYIRMHADELNIDPDKIIVMGDSAGGHLAACLGTIDGFDDLQDNLSISSKPNAMVLYNPGLDMTLPPHVVNFIKHKTILGKDLNQNLALLTSKDYENAKAISPVFHVKKNQPPTLVLHGLDDKVILPESSIRFTDSMKSVGNFCDLILLNQTRHAFVVPKYTASEATVVNAITKADLFITSLHYISGSPILKLSPIPAWTIK